MPAYRGRAPVPVAAIRKWDKCMSFGHYNFAIKALLMDDSDERVMNGPFATMALVAI